MKSKSARIMAVAAAAVCLLFVAFVLSTFQWGPWWQRHYGVVGMRFRYLDKNPKVLAAFAAASIKHLEDEGMVRCVPPSQFGDGRVGTSSDKGEIMADCYWFRCSNFAGYFRLDAWGDPLYACGLDVIAESPRPPMGASSTFVTLINPPALMEWDKWAGDHGAYATNDAIPR